MKNLLYILVVLISYVGFSQNQINYTDDKTPVQTGVVLNASDQTPEISLYPNPVKNVLHVSPIKGGQALSVYNMLGQKVLFRKMNSNQRTQLDFSSLPSGVYVLKVDGDNWKKTLKIVKE